jgi:hypothetical protein
MNNAACGVLRLAPLNHSRALAERDQVLRLQTRGRPIGSTGDQQIDRAGEDLVGAFAADHLERHFGRIYPKLSARARAVQ